MTPSECIRRILLPCSLEAVYKVVHFWKVWEGHAINLEKKKFKEEMETIFTEFGQVTYK